MEFGFRIPNKKYFFPDYLRCDEIRLLSSLKSVLFAVLSRSRALTVLYIKSETRLSSVEALTV